MRNKNPTKTNLRYNNLTECKEREEKIQWGGKSVHINRSRYVQAQRQALCKRWAGLLTIPNARPLFPGHLQPCQLLLLCDLTQLQFSELPVWHVRALSIPGSSSCSIRVLCRILLEHGGPCDTPYPRASARTALSKVPGSPEMPDHSKLSSLLFCLDPVKESSYSCSCNLIFFYQIPLITWWLKDYDMPCAVRRWASFLTQDLVPRPRQWARCQGPLCVKCSQTTFPFEDAKVCSKQITQVIFSNR